MGSGSFLHHLSVNFSVLLPFPSLEVRKMKPALSSRPMVELSELLMVTLPARCLVLGKHWANFVLTWWLSEQRGWNLELLPLIFDMRSREKETEKPKRRRKRRERDPQIGSGGEERDRKKSHLLHFLWFPSHCDSFLGFASSC